MNTCHKVVPLENTKDEKHTDSLLMCIDISYSYIKTINWIDDIEFVKLDQQKLEKVWY